MNDENHDRPAPRPSGRPTMREVAERAGVSKALVSLVFRGAPGASARNRARVLEVADEIGYRHNRTASLLARRRNHLIGVSMILRNPFHAELVEEIQAHADELGYDLALSPRTRTHDEARSIETLLELRCEALILLGPDTTGPRLDALGRQLPVVVVGRRIGSTYLDVVRASDDKGLEQVVDHLAELGHRRIVHVDAGKGTIASDRRRGYRKAMRRNGIEANVHIIPGDFTEESGRRAATSILNLDDRPTAVIAANDRSATGLLDGLKRGGVDIPGEISVAGYDNSLLAQMAYVDLTSVSQSIPHQAQHAVNAVVERLEGVRSIPREVVLTPKLIQRASTAPASKPG